ncbi:Uncharacterised protein [Candidatus Anstonella stagnisolia]|nr:Uncharacterised protein [Candidatus Anstonella stagnisolia]
MDIDAGIRYAYGALKEKKHYLDFALLAIAMMALQALSVAAMALLSGDAQKVSRYAITILMALATTYFLLKFLHFRLASEKLTAAKYSAGLYAHALLALITAGLHTLFFWRAKKLLLLYVPFFIGLAGIILFALNAANSRLLMGQPGLMGGPGPVQIIIYGCFFCSLFALIIAWIYNGVRLSLMAQLALCNPKIEMGACSQKSWALTWHKSLTIFGARLMFTLSGFVAVVALALALIFAAVFAASAFGPLLGSSTIAGVAVLAALAVFVLCMLVSALWIGAEAYLYAFIYKSILPGAKTGKKK